MINNTKENTAYYNNIAINYDDDRFGNSYGKFIDFQERKLLTHLLKYSDINSTLDLGCGTGRFLDYANFGIDASEEMVKVAKLKYPEKNIDVGTAQHTNFEDCKFNIIFSFHVFMHLDKPLVLKILNEAYRILETGGRLIFDVPSKKRRNLFSFKSKTWHGANCYTVNEIKKICNKKWELTNYFGILFFPIHRIPKKLRNKFIHFDNLLVKTIIKEYSSYLVFELIKK